MGLEERRPGGLHQRGQAGAAGSGTWQVEERRDLAQSCLAPGFFTLASNMATTSSLDIMPEMARWKKDYLSTTNKVADGQVIFHL